MNDCNVITKLVEISNFCDNVCINISKFADIIVSSQNEFSMIQAADILKTGYYATINNMKIHVGRIAGPEEIMFSNKISPNSRNSDDWSKPIPFDTPTDKIKKYIELSLFW